jgi:crotonobetainyl-CoA:carnitine CoA-transferase CaiB-like acyl-CoA transferase
VNTDPQVRAFLDATDRRHLLEDERFASVAARARHVSEWFAIRGAPLTAKTTSEWLDALRAADIAAQPCHTLESLQRDPHLEAVGLIQHEQHPTEGRTAAIRCSIRFDEGYPDLRAPSQPRGWDTESILGELGFQDKEIVALLASKAAFSTN